MKWLGLTGGIASGKSTARKLIEGLGYPTIDADEISHAITKPGEIGYGKIVSHFGSSYLIPTQEIDRKKLGTLIFQQPEQRVILENLLHPLIQDVVKAKRSEYQAQGFQLCFYDIPLLFEKNLMTKFDQTILIWCDAETQLNRLMNRNNLTLGEAVLRLKNQISLNEKVKWADSCIDNSGHQSDLKKQLIRLLDTLKGF